MVRALKPFIHKILRKTIKKDNPMPDNISGKPNSNSSSRRSFLQSALIGGTAATLAPLYAAGAAARDVSPKTPNGEGVPRPADVKPFELEEITIPELQDGVKSGKFT